MSSTVSSSTNNSSSTTNPVSIASSSSAGAAGGSVINVSTLVSELVAATEAPQQSIINDQTQTVTANVSAVATLKSALSTFQSSLSSLDSASAFNSVSASSSDQSAFTATASSGAVAGSYSVAVTSLASAQQLLSKPFAGGSGTTLGTGTLTLSVGGSSFSVGIDSSNDTVAGIASAINSAAGNTGVNAAVVSGTDGAHLVLSSSLTGAANTLSVGETETDGGSGLAALTYGSGNTGNYTEQSQAADASFSIAGVAYTSASNTVSDALSGVTLDLLGTTASDTNGSATLTVANDTSTVEGNIQSFVSAYNTLQSTLKSLGSYDSSNSSAGQLMDNPVLTGIQSQINHAVYSLVGSSTYNTLASIGITTNSDGSLSLNSSTLQSTLSSNFSAVSQLFSSSNGVATQLNSAISSALSTSGSIGEYTQELTKQENSLTQQSDKLTTQMNALSTSLTQQYSALNSLLSSLQTTSSYLSQAISSLPTVQGKSNA